MITWYLNGVSFSSLGITMVAGNFLSHAASTVTLRVDAAFDATPILSYGADVVITYQVDALTPVNYFAGKVISVPRFGSAEEEGQTYEIADAWHELERTIYQESWGYGELVDEIDKVHVRADKEVPRAVFGMDATGTRIPVGTQIANAIAYAAAAGVDIQAGAIPTGEVPIPSQLDNVSVAEVISMALKFHPDWIPAIDHTTTPPTLNVTPVATMTAVSYPVDGSGETEFDIVERTDLLPDAVRIVYDFAGEANVDGEPEIFRKAVIDKYPSDGPDAGPGVLCSIVPLQGMSEQRQKSRLFVRTIPTDTGHADIKTWIKSTWTHLKDLDDADFTVTNFTRAMLPEPAGLPDPINPKAERLDWSSDVSKYPRELLAGSVEDWMRVRVAKSIVTVSIQSAAGISDAKRALINKGTPMVTITATSATNKTYTAPSQWSDGEEVPIGVAESVYRAIHAGVRWQGSVTVSADEVPLDPLLGKKINLTGSAVTAWSTMGAPIHSASWDIASGKATIGFGPVPYLAPQDFLEMQRILRGMPATWWSDDERTEDKSGAEDKPSAIGDTVGAFDLPEKTFEPPAVPLPPFYPSLVAGNTKVKVSSGCVVERIPIDDASTLSVIPAYNITSEFAISTGQQVAVRVDVTQEGRMTGTNPVSIVVTAEDADSVHYYPVAGDDRSGRVGYFIYKLAVLRAGTGGDPPWLEMFLAGSHIDHFQSLNLLENTIDEALPEHGRILQKFDAPTGRYLLRALKEHEDSEVKIEETGDFVQIRGNSKIGTLSYQPEGGSPIEVMQWTDGLVTTEGDVVIPLDEEGMTCDVILEDCPGSGTGRILRMSFENGRLVAVDADDETRPLAETTYTKQVQSCCFVDDPANDDWRT